MAPSGDNLCPRQEKDQQHFAPEVISWDSVRAAQPTNEKIIC